MKSAKVLYKFERSEMNSVVDGILIENSMDIDLLQKELEQAEHTVLVKIVKSKETVDRINHVVNGFRPFEKSIAKYAIHQSRMLGNNPLYNLGLSTEKILDTVRKVLENYGNVFINTSGAFCNIGDNMEILETSEFISFPNPPKYFIQDGSKVINLENDFELEDDAVSYMSKNFNQKFSYIKDMRILESGDFLKIFTEFKEKGGDTVYVYTTGMDYEQMYEYSKHAVNCGLKKFIFDFNAGLDENINIFIKWLTERAEVTILNQLENA